MNIEIKSKRICLRPFKSLDPSNEYLNWMNDKNISKFIIKSNKNKKKDIRVFLASMKSHKDFFFKIIYNKNSKHIGNLRIGPLNFNNLSSKFGIMIGNKKYHGVGIGKEATKLAESFIFNFLNFKKMEFECIIDNIAAMQVYRSLDFIEKKIKKKVIINGEKFDQVLFYKYNKS
tara:strand:- start:125 stop:646 length:522 start_codon:yes stop_codon:yes gene_type:complete